MQACKFVLAVKSVVTGCDAIVIPGIYHSSKFGLWQWSAFSEKHLTQSLHKSVMIQKCTRKNVPIFIEGASLYVPPVLDHCWNVLLHTCEVMSRHHQV